MTDLVKKYARISFWSIAFFLVLSVVFWWIGGDSLKFRLNETKMTDRTNVVHEIVINNTLRQDLISEVDRIDAIKIIPATFSRENKGSVNFELKDAESGELLAFKDIPVASFQDNKEYIVKFNRPVERVSGKLLSLIITSDDSVSGSAVTFWYGVSGEDSRGKLYMNEEIITGRLCYSIQSKEILTFGRYYYLWVFVIVILMIGCAFYWCYKTLKGKKTVGGDLFWAIDTYRFLYKQLIIRDFKTKYKRSVLGMLWSFFNPLLTMAVQYVVFSTLFKTDIKNYPVYLLIGIVFFNFFSEAITLGLMSITGNASLITKVYVPKYIYPITRVISSSINLFISMIPLLFVVLLVGTRIHKSMFLLVFSIFCIIVFSIGITFILSSAMVFFRDTQFLWGIISMVWMYCTPIFYPESILPRELSFIHKLNPLYYFIKFSRIVVIDGVSPEPVMYIVCIVCAVSSFLLGGFIFKKSQDKFALYL